MPFVTDGSRILTSERLALGAIDENITLSSISDPFIFCGGVYLSTPGATFANASGHTITWHWRVVGGSFVQVAETGEVKWSLGTVLVDQAAVGAQFTTQTNNVIAGAMQEFKGSSSAVVIGTLTGQTEIGEGCESHIALSINEAIGGATYEMMARCTWSGGTKDMEYVSRFTVPERPLIASIIPYAPTQLGDPYYGDPG